MVSEYGRSGRMEQFPLISGFGEHRFSESQEGETEAVSLASCRLDMAAVERIPYETARKYHVIAVGKEGEALLVAMDDPANFYAADAVSLAVDGPVKYVTAPREEIDSAIEECYAEIEARSAVQAANKAVSGSGRQSAGRGGQDEADEGDTAPVVRLLNSLLVRGYKANASDIHIEPRKDALMVRMRIDGLLQEFTRLEKKLQMPLTARIKVLAGMDIAEKRLPQDGHFKSVLSGMEMDIRVSTVRSVFGENVVLRFLNTDMTVDREDMLGMDRENYEKVLRILRHSHGLLYITGPTGSGKTTTLYMILRRLVREPVNVMTIEDPVERNIDGANQIQVNSQAGLTFENGLRAVLRQDPDVIMVGETRDTQTARISVRAAITGHLVLSTLHTNDAVGAITRMKDMGVEPFLVTNSLAGVVAQRLVRKICPRCGRSVGVREEEQAVLGERLETVRRGSGCYYCGHTGYKGRIAVHEVFVMDRALREMILAGRPEEEMREYVRKHQQMTTLKENLLGLVRDGVTTVEEFVRLTYGE